ncbi:hypothetical protein EON81_29875, partial [bacterium]
MIALIAQVAIMRTHEFVLFAPEGTKRANVAGTFNGWNKDAHPMVLDADGRTFRLKVDVPVGKVQYKFVLNGETWIVDPKGKTIDDGNGNRNSEVVLLPAGFETAAEPGDANLTRSAIFHAQTPSWLNLDRGQLTFRIQTRAHDVGKVELNADNRVVKTMARDSGDELYDVWSATIPYPNRSFGYGFALDGMKGGHFEFDKAKFQPLEVAPWVQDATSSGWN